MASSQALGFMVVLCLGAFSGSAVGYYSWPIPGNTLTPPPQEDTCQDVNNYYTSCENYITGADSQYPSQDCCSGLSYLDQISKNEVNGPRRICQCIEDVAARGGHAPYSASRINDLYSYCNVHLNFPISEHMNCSRI